MASISRALRRVKEQFRSLLPDHLIEAVCADLKHKHRKRKLDPVTVVHLFVQQVLAGNTAVAHLRRLSGMRFDPSAYCVARNRLPVELLEELARRLAGIVRDATADQGRWRGHRVWLVDGSSCSMSDTPGLQAAFGQPGGQRPGCGFPVSRLLGLFDASTGMLLDLLAAPLRTHEMSRVSALHALLKTGDVLVGDRGLCSYAHLALLQKAGIHGVFRQHQRRLTSFAPPRRSGAKTRRRRMTPRQRRALSRRLRTLGDGDQVVTVPKPESKPVWMSDADWRALPGSIVVRELRFTVREAGCRVRQVTLVTTLVDPKQYPKSELAKLYRVRWRVELDLRHLKTTMKMDVLRCKSADGVRKELLVFAMVYNMVCLVRSRAAQQQRVAADRVSFVDVVRWLQAAEPGEPLPRFIVNPARPRRHEPRVVKRRPKQYHRLIRPRAEYKNIRESQRIPA